MKRKIAVFLTVVGMATSSFAISWSTMRTQIRVMIKDSHATRQRYSDSQLLELANEGMREINVATWAIAKSSAVTLVNGTTSYTLPSDFLVTLRVTKDYKMLTETTLDKQDADFGSGSWQLTGGTPQRYYIDPTNAEKIAMYPFPNSSSSTGTLRINYVAQVSSMTADTSEAFNGIDRLQDYVESIMFYVAYRVYLVEGENKGDYYRKEYEAAIANMRARVGTSPNYNPGFSGGTTR